MRLFTVFLFAASLSAAARSAGQTVTLSGKHVPLEKVFATIEKQTGYVVFFSMGQLAGSKPIALNVKDMPLQQFLDQVLADQPLTARIEDKTIFLSRKTLVAPELSFVIPPPVRIRVVDSTGRPLAGITVSLKKSRILGITDADGVVTAAVNAGEVLVFSSVGYQETERTVSDAASLTVTLSQSATRLDEVEVTVNTGYQSLSRERVTGSFSTISGKRLDTKLRPDMKAALEGQAAGVVITKDGNIEIRGLSTMTSGIKEPLIVVDGFPISGGLETINIDNIESITVLKDAVAASIYGARSSNGVIVVTTKQATRGSMQVGYKGSVGVTLKPYLSYLNRSSSADYVDAELEIYNQDPSSFINPYGADNFNISTVNYLSVLRSQNKITQQDFDKQIATLKTQNGIGQVEKYLFRNQIQQQHDIFLSGGTEKSALNAAVKYISNKNNTIYNEDSRLIVDLKNDWKISKRINVQLLSNVNYTRSSAPVRSWSEFTEYGASSLIQPYDLIVDPVTGQPQDINGPNPFKVQRYANIPGLKPVNYNPLEDLQLETRKINNLQVRMGGNIRIQLLKGLNLEGGGTWTKGSGLDRSFYSKDSYRMRMGYNDATSVSDPTKHYIPAGNMVNEARNMNEYYMLRGQLTYNTLFGRHRLSFLAGGEVSKDILDNNVYPTRFGYNDQAGVFGQINQADFSTSVYSSDMLGGSYSQLTASNGSYAFNDTRAVSTYANGSYEYDNRFIASGSIRVDQTNFFGTNPKYRYKPLWSVGGTYKLSNEKFFDISWLDKLNLRASYGVNGNIWLNSGPFLIISPGQYSALTGGTTYSISSPPNNSLRWERTNTINLGTDLIIKKRLNMTVDYYFRKSSDLLADNAFDVTRGFNSIVRNVGQLNNKGVEVSLNADVIKHRNLVWNVLFNLSYNANKVTEYDYSYQYAITLTNGPRFKEGYPSSAIFAYQFAGLDNNGVAQYYNRNKQKVGVSSIVGDDLVYAGTLRPKFVYGLTNSIHYKRWALSFLIVAHTGHVLRTDAFGGSNYANKHVAQRWRKPGDETTTIYPKIAAYNNDGISYPYSDMFMESARFLKLRDASLVYDINPSWSRKVGIANAKVYFQTRNLFMITANSDGRDPETSQVEASNGSVFTDAGFTSLPLRPEFYIGLSIGF